MMQEKQFVMIVEDRSQHTHLVHTKWTLEKSS